MCSSDSAKVLKSMVIMADVNYQIGLISSGPVFRNITQTGYMMFLFNPEGDGPPYLYTLILFI